MGMTPAVLIRIGMYWVLLCWEAEELDVDQARQRAERRAWKHPLRQRFSSARAYIYIGTSV